MSIEFISSRIYCDKSCMVLHVSINLVRFCGAMYGLILFWTFDRLNAIQANTYPSFSIIIIVSTLTGLIPIVHSMIVPIILKFSMAHSAHFEGGLVRFPLSNSGQVVVSIEGFHISRSFQCYYSNHVFSQMLWRFAGFCMNSSQPKLNHI